MESIGKCAKVKLWTPKIAETGGGVKTLIIEYLLQTILDTKW